MFDTHNGKRQKEKREKKKKKKKKKTTSVTKTKSASGGTAVDAVDAVDDDEVSYDQGFIKVFAGYGPGTILKATKARPGKERREAEKKAKANKEADPQAARRKRGDRGRLMFSMGVLAEDSALQNMLDYLNGMPRVSPAGATTEKDGGGDTPVDGAAVSGGDDDKTGEEVEEEEEELPPPVTMLHRPLFPASLFRRTSHYPICVDHTGRVYLPWMQLEDPEDRDHPNHGPNTPYGRERAARELRNRGVPSKTCCVLVLDASNGRIQRYFGNCYLDLRSAAPHVSVDGDGNALVCHLTSTGERRREEKRREASKEKRRGGKKKRGGVLPCRALQGRCITHELSQE